MTDPLPLPNQPLTYSHLPAGWVEAFNKIITLLDTEAPCWTVQQVKEKFAYLNVYWQPPPGMAAECSRELGRAVEAIELSTARICEVCGQPGETWTERYYRRTRCRTHQDAGIHPDDAPLRVRAEPEPAGAGNLVHVLLDVDGVINSLRWKKPPRDGWTRHTKYKHVFGRYDGAPLTGADHGAFTIKYSPDLVDALNTLAARPDVRLHWLTTWLDEARYGLAPRIGLHGTTWPVLGKSDYHAREQGGWWKLRAAQAHAHAHPDVRIVWIDDDLVHSNDAIEWFDAIWPRMLLVLPQSEVGLTPQDVADLTAWIDGRDPDEGAYE